MALHDLHEPPADPRAFVVRSIFGMKHDDLVQAEQTLRKKNQELVGFSFLLLAYLALS